MRLPSIDELRVHAAEAFRRFPYTISAGLLSAFLVIAYAEDVDEVFGFLTRSGDGSDLLVATTLALPLMFAIRMAEERGVLSKLAAGGARLVGVVGLGYVVWRWPEWSEKLKLLHYLQISLGLHALAAFLPFAREGELNGFWQYNRSLLLRFLIGAFFSLVLFAGLSIALAAIEQLFGVDIPGEPYADLFGVVGFAFQTWFFTAGVPANLGDLDRAREYPNGLKVFSQYVLIPLVTVYLAILTAYLAKVLITTEWPSGWIGWLVSCVSVAGILSILLTHPIRHREENRWIVTYGRWFWIAMIPAIGMLFAAIWKRIDQYGITEPRYFLFVLTAWLTAMAVLYGFLRSQNIKWLPASLGAIAFVTLVGPWSAYAVSRSSQLSRLEALLERNGRLVDGAVTGVGAPEGAAPAGDTIPLEDRRQIGATFQYLYAHHGSDALEGLLPPELAATDSVGGTRPIREWLARDRAAAVMADLGIEWAEPVGPSDLQAFHLQTEPGEAVETAGYAYVFTAGRHGTATVAGRALSFDVEGLSVTVRAGDTTLVVVPMGPAVERGLERAGAGASGPARMVPQELLRTDASAPGIEVRFHPTWLSGRRGDDGELTLDAANGLWLMNWDAAAGAVPADTAPAGTDTTTIE